MNARVRLDLFRRIHVEVQPKEIIVSCLAAVSRGQKPTSSHRGVVVYFDASDRWQTELPKLGILRTKLAEMSAVRRTIKTNHLSRLACVPPLTATYHTVPRINPTGSADSY